MASEQVMCEFHASCFMVALFFLGLTYVDHVPVDISYDSNAVRLSGWQRWYMLPVQVYTLTACYFLISTFLDMGTTSSRRLQSFAGLLFAVAYPANLFVSAWTSFVVAPAYRRSSNGEGKLCKLGLGGRPRPLPLHNTGSIMVTGELVLSGRCVPWRDAPAMVLFAAFYCVCHLSLFNHHRVYAYPILDGREPKAAAMHLLVLVSAALLFCIGPLVTALRCAEPLGRFWTNMCILAMTMVLVPFREPRARSPVSEAKGKVD